MVHWLCSTCEGHFNHQDNLEEQGLVLARCLAYHHSLTEVSLYRSQGLALTKSIAMASPEDAKIHEDKDKVKARLDELDSLKKFGPERVIYMSIVDFPNIAPMRFVVQEFTPQEGDNLFKSYDGVNGEKKQVATAPWCIANIRQYRDDFYPYIVANYPKVAASMGEGIKGIFELSQSDQVPQTFKEFYTGFSIFIFCALLKTSSGYLEGPEYLDTEPIDEPGHRLHGMRICPRMLIAQTDPLETMTWLAPAQKDLLSLLLPLLESKEINDWAPVMAIISSLNQMVAFIIKDRIRHGRENFDKPFTVPEYVNEAVLALMVLITKFHKMESEAPYTREEALKASPKVYQDIFRRTTVTNYKEDRNYARSSWWNGQLFDTNPDWVPYPPIMPGEEVPEAPKSSPKPTFDGLKYEPSSHDAAASWW